MYSRTISQAQFMRIFYTFAFQDEFGATLSGMMGALAEIQKKGDSMLAGIRRQREVFCFNQKYISINIQAERKSQSRDSNLAFSGFKPVGGEGGTSGDQKEGRGGDLGTSESDIINIYKQHQCNYKHSNFLYLIRFLKKNPTNVGDQINTDFE